MPNYYYIARRKYRGQPHARYMGDGIIKAKNVTEAKKLVAHQRGTPRNLVEVRLRPQDNGVDVCTNCGQVHSAAIRESLKAGHKPIMQAAARTTYIFKQVLDATGDSTREVVTNKPIRFQYKNETVTPRYMQGVADKIFIFFTGDPRTFDLKEYRNEIYISA